MLKAIFAGAVLLISGAFAQSYDKGVASTRQTQLGWGMPAVAKGYTLYMTSANWAWDSLGSKKTLDTARYLPYTGAVGACTRPFAIEDPSNSVQPISFCELGYRTRATDTAQRGTRWSIYTRYPYPAPDSNWRSGQSQWDTVRVITWHSVPEVPLTTFSWGHSFRISGGEAKLCVERTSDGPGTGDSVIVSVPMVRCW